MPPQIATFVFALGIIGLFVLDRDRESRTSPVLWIPVVWVLIAGSRMVSEWLDLAPMSDSPDQYLEGSSFDRNVLTGLLAVGLVVLLLRRRRVGTLLRANAPILMFFLYCGLSVFWSDYPDVALKRWTKALGDLVMVLIVLTDLDPTAAIKKLLARVGFLLIPLSILLIKFYPDLARVYSPWTGSVSYTGVTTNKNSLGLICLIFGVGSAWRLFQVLRARKSNQRTRTLIAHGAVLAMVLWLFHMANSATSFSCFLMASGLIAVTNLSARARQPWVVHLLVVGLLSLAFSALFLDPGGDLVGTVGRDSTLTGRREIWQVVLTMVPHPLFGTGFENFWLGQRLQKIWAIYWWHPNEAHNGYLEVFLNLGWIGLILLAAVLVTGYHKVIVLFRQDPHAGRIRLAYFVVGIVYSFTEAGFRMMSPVWIAFLLATTAVPQNLLPKARASAPKAPADKVVSELPADTEHVYEECV